MEELLKKFFCIKKENKHVEARELFEKILQNNSQSIPALGNLVLIFKRHKMFDEALRCRRRMLKLAPDDPRALAHYIDQLIETTRHEVGTLANKLARQIAEKKMSSFAPFETVGDAMLIAAVRQDAMAIAHDVYKKAIALGSHGAAWKLAMSLRSLGQYDESTKLFKDSMRMMLEQNKINRITVAQRILDFKKRGSYLEVGVFKGTAFLQISAERKVGVDPEFIIPGGLVTAEGEEYYSLESDEFFASPKSIFPPGGFDVVLIDGKHSFEQSLRDALNALEYLQEDGVILMHDCLLTKPAGVWKSIVHLRSMRHDLRVFVLDTDCGIGIIVKAPPENSLDYTEEEIRNLTEEDLAKNKDSFLNLKPASYFEQFITERGRPREDRVPV